MIPPQRNAAQRLSAHAAKSRLRRILEEMPTLLWLFHKGPLTLGCLFIILPHPQTHSHGSLLSRAVHLCVCFALLCFLKVLFVRRGSADGENQLSRLLSIPIVAFTGWWSCMHTERLCDVCYWHNNHYSRVKNNEQFLQRKDLNF